VIRQFEESLSFASLLHPATDLVCWPTSRAKAVNSEAAVISRSTTWRLLHSLTIDLHLLQTEVEPRTHEYTVQQFPFSTTCPIFRARSFITSLYKLFCWHFQETEGSRGVIMGRGGVGNGGCWQYLFNQPVPRPSRSQLPRLPRH